MEEKKRKKKGKKFQKFIIIYCSIFAVFMIATWVLLFCFIKDYEQGQPKHVMEDIVSNFTEDSVGTLLGDDVATNEFESKDMVVRYLAECGKSGDVTYRKKPRDYSETTPVYELIVNKKAIAKVTLAASKKNAFKFNVWAVGSVSIADYISGKEAAVYTVAVPTGSKVSVNGIEVKDSYISDEKEFEPCKNIADYVNTTPTITEYEIKGLLFAPEVEVTYDGVKLINESKEDDTFNIVFGFPTDDSWASDNKEAVERVAQNYSLYIINKMDLATLTKDMTGKAKELVSDIPAIWAFKKGGVASFDEIKISDCRKYSDTCYSVNVKFNMHVEWPNDSTVDPKDYPTNLTLCYVKSDGKWKVANFVVEKMD